MTFQEYFTKCQELITQRIELPFDVPFPQAWIEKFSSNFLARFGFDLTPEQAVIAHFYMIENEYQEKIKTKKK